MNYNLVLAGVIKSRCGLSNYPTCNNDVVLVLFIISIIICIPFMYVLTSILIDANKFKSVKIDKGSLFCVLTVMNCLINSFSYLTPLHMFANNGLSNAYVLVQVANIFQVFSIVLYFNEITKILIMFKVFGGKFLHILSIVLLFLLVLLSFIQYIQSFIKNEKMAIYLYRILFEKDALIYMSTSIYCLSFIILSITFIFSTLKEFLDLSKRKKLCVALFFIPIAILIQYLQNYSINSTCWKVKIYNYLEPYMFYTDDKVHANIYLYLYIFYLSNWYSFMNIIPLYILNILSVSNEKVLEAEQSTNNVLESVIAI